MKKLLDRKITKLLLIGLPVVLAGAGLYWFSFLPKSNVVHLEGSVEIATSPYYARTSGIIKEVRVETGQEVKAGDILALLDDRDIDNQMEQQKAVLAIKEAKLNQLLKLPDTAAVDAARNAAQNTVAICQEKLSIASASLEHAKKDLEIQRQLYEASAISLHVLEQYERTVEEMESGVSIAREELAAARHNVDTIVYPEQSSDELEAARADIRLTQLQIESLEDSRQDYVVRALQDGVVVGKSIMEGAMAVQGQSLFELSNEQDKYFVFYLPQEYTEYAVFGGELSLYRVNGSEAAGKAEICYIDWKAVYTPKDFETSTNKNKKSIKIKAWIKSGEGLGAGENLITEINLS